MNKSTLRHIVKCKTCHKNVLDHMQVCPFCGAKLESKYADFSNIKKEFNPKLKLVLYVLAIISIIAILIKNLL